MQKWLIQIVCKQFCCGAVDAVAEGDEGIKCFCLMDQQVLPFWVCLQSSIYFEKRVMGNKGIFGDLVVTVPEMGVYPDVGQVMLGIGVYVRGEFVYFKWLVPFGIHCKCRSLWMGSKGVDEVVTKLGIGYVRVLVYIHAGHFAQIKR